MKGRTPEKGASTVVYFWWTKKVTYQTEKIWQSFCKTWHRIDWISAMFPPQSKQLHMSEKVIDLSVYCVL